MDAVHFSSKTEEWATPQDFFDKLNEEFHFTLDVCSTHENAKCAKHYTKDDDGLSQDWTGETVWCNPPYGRQMPKWIKKCAEHGKQGGAGGHAHSSTNRHESVSRIHLRQVGDPFRQRQIAFCEAERRKHRQSTFSVNGCYLQTEMM